MNVKEVVEFVLFGDVEEAPLNLVSEELGLEDPDDTELMGMDQEEYWRTAIAAAIKQKFGKHD